jgi:putative membrane protein
MKKLLSYFGLGILLTVGMTACGGGATNIAVNAGRSASNAASGVTNSVGNTVGSAVNSVSNAVSGATTSSADSFMKEAAQGGLAEIEMGKLAQEKSKNPEIKKFGQMMVTDHTAAGNDLKALAAKKNVTLPSDTGSHKSMIDSLSKETDGFDKAYVNGMVSDHESDLKAFKSQADSASDPDVKAFAAKVVPVIQKHLDAIKAIEAKMK